MGTLLRVSVEGSDRQHGLRATEAAFAEVRRLEGILSTWDPAAEMARLNAAPAGRPAAVSPELFALLVEAERWAAETGRAFEPVVGPLIDAWDLRGEGRRPGDARLAEALAAVRAGVELLPGEPALRRAHPDAWIDTGGFGKGAALGAAGAALRAAGVARATLDFGGQVLAIGAPVGEDGWAV
ncbi:MAG TPA: FAD:protein FMN transferase, partial [Longimicrobiales bacterium]|nr:FAD:protein FMN transferase [Longimicrobiales bacterium]